MIVPFERNIPADDESKSREKRSERVRQLTEVALQHWRRSNRVRSDGTILPVFTDLPRAKGLGTEKRRPAAFPPRREEVTFKAGFFSTLGRIFLWLWGALYFVCGVAYDRFRGIDSDEARAVRLRHTFEMLGTTFIKLGQQLSMRLDVLPYAYTRELESMLDSVPPIAQAQAIAIVERAIGKPINEAFARFDSEPIGSASIACVYHAVLKTGEHVAVKVRRPRIGEQLIADMRALEWLLILGELALIPPDFTANFIRELRMMLIEELDFVREARFGDLYRKATRKHKQFHFVTAPKVFFKHSNAEVLVTEFVQGYWMHEIITALETDDQAAIARMHEMNIDPIVLARRVQLIARFNNFENIFFHADIHPANMLVQPGNKIVLIDFGSCGSFSRKELNSWRRWFDAQSINDVSGMVQASLAIIEPLPPINKDEFALRLESVFWNDLYAIKSKQSDWHERISARVWLGFLKLSREYNVPMRLNMLRMIRASMLSDTIAARLDHDQDPYKEFRHYEKGAGKRAKKRIIKRLHRLLGPSKYIRIENGIEAALKSVYQLQRTLDSVRNIRIIPLIGKAAQFFLLALRASVWIGSLAFIWTMSIFVTEIYQSRRNPLAGEPRDLLTIFNETLLDWRFEMIVLIILGLAGRRILKRLMARDKTDR